jgi:hypothetical protein
MAETSTVRGAGTLWDASAAATPSNFGIGPRRQLRVAAPSATTAANAARWKTARADHDAVWGGGA